MVIGQANTLPYAIEIAKATLQNANFELNKESGEKVADFIKAVNDGLSKVLNERQNST